MAVADTSATALLSTAQYVEATRALYTTGANIGALLSTVAVAAADDNNSVYRLFEGLSYNLVPLIMLVACTAITNGTDYNVGIFEDGGAVIIDNAFGDALDLSSALALAPGVAKNGMGNVLAADMSKKLYEHAGHTASNFRTTYDIAATGIAVGTAAGTITTLLIYAL